jgi:hypothetical protein
MYSVRVYSCGTMRSFHHETPAGLQAAVEEANMRTHGFGYAHMVTDNHGLRLHLALPKDVEAKLQAVAVSKRAERLIAWLAFAIILVAVFSRR